MADIARIYAGGFSPEDLTLSPGLVLVRPVRPPERTAAGIVTSLATTRIEGTKALMYEVVGVADGVSVPVGSVVVLRNALLDPIQPDLDLLVIKSDHIVATVR